VKMENISAGQIARHLLERPQQATVSFERHPGIVSRSADVKLVRYQTNPSLNWGPKPRANPKRKREPMEDIAMTDPAE